MKNKLFTLFASFLTVLFIIFIANSTKALAAESPFPYESTNAGNYIGNGVANGDTYNYSYTSTSQIPVDSEGFVNYQDQAYVKKTVKANPQKQGLFDVTLDIKGNQLPHPPLDVVLVIDYSSSMQGEKLTNTLKGLQEFGTELGDSLSNGVVQIGIVAYNRDMYSTNGFTNDMNELQNFLTSTAQSHTGTFIQKGLIAGQELLLNQGRSGAEKILIHIGDGSANRSYLPAVGATSYPNTGEITDYNGFHTANYVKDFQTTSEKFNTSDTISDPNGTKVDKEIVTDATLGTIVALKESGITTYSIGTAPTARGEYIARNIADKESHYRPIDENLLELGDALKTIINAVTKTIPNGTVTDPMGKDILLQGSGNFSKTNYSATGWKKDSDGNWQSTDVLTRNLEVNEQNQVITLSNFALGANERITVTYQIRLNTEATDFKGEFWYFCNQRTTLDPTSTGSSLLDFPIPSIKAPTVKLSLEKQWKNAPEAVIPDKIDYQVIRTPLITPAAWTASDTLSLTKEKNFKTTLFTVPILGVNNDLPLYNNAGETISYSVNEVNIPDGFDFSLNQENNHFTLINTYKETSTSTTESSSSESSTTDSSSSESTSQSSTSESNSSESSTTVVTSTESTVVETSESSRKPTVSKTTSASGKSYPKTNDERASKIWMLIGTSLLGASLYLLKKFN